MSWNNYTYLTAKVKHKSVLFENIQQSLGFKRREHKGAAEGIKAWSHQDTLHSKSVNSHSSVDFTKDFHSGMMTRAAITNKNTDNENSWQ